MQGNSFTVRVPVVGSASVVLSGFGIGGGVGGALDPRYVTVDNDTSINGYKTFLSGLASMGTVGIATTNPRTQLDVSGEIRGAGLSLFNTTNNQVYLRMLGQQFGGTDVVLESNPAGLVCNSHFYCGDFNCNSIEANGNIKGTTFLARTDNLENVFAVSGSGDVTMANPSGNLITLGFEGHMGGGTPYRWELQGTPVGLATSADFYCGTLTANWIRSAGNARYDINSNDLYDNANQFAINLGSRRLADPSEYTSVLWGSCCLYSPSPTEDNLALNWKQRVLSGNWSASGDLRFANSTGYGITTSGVGVFAGVKQGARVVTGASGLLLEISSGIGATYGVILVSGNGITGRLPDLTAPSYINNAPSYTFKMIVNGTGTISGFNNNQLIDGQPKVGLSGLYKYIQLQPYSSGWWIIGQN